MLNFGLSSISVIVVGLIFLRFHADEHGKDVGWIRGLKVAALIPLVLQSLILALFGFGEMASGDLSGAGHLAPLALTILLAFLTWKRPLEGGVALLIVGLGTMAEFYDAMARMIMAAPQLVSGGLFMLAGLAGRFKSPQTHQQAG